MRRLGPLGIVALLILLLSLLLGGGYGAHQLTINNHFCAACHAYEKTSWDQSEHRQVDCIECHTKGFAYDKIQGTRKVWLTVTGQVNPHNDPLPRYPEETSENCVDCHITDAIAEEQPFFIARHNRYMEHAATCMACHDSGHERQLQRMKRP